MADQLAVWQVPRPQQQYLQGMDGRKDVSSSMGGTGYLHYSSLAQLREWTYRDGF